ncbi:WD repeat-containing protein 36 [Trichinella sp. T6]|nr:WD repeat-containing protein 36 [Trichinella sp. T6]
MSMLTMFLNPLSYNESVLVLPPSFRIVRPELSHEDIVPQVTRWTSPTLPDELPRTLRWLLQGIFPFLMTLLHPVETVLVVIRQVPWESNTDLGFRPGGLWLVSSSLDCTIEVWVLASACLVDVLAFDDACRSFAINPNIKQMPADYEPATVFQLPGASCIDEKESTESGDEVVEQHPMQQEVTEEDEEVAQPSRLLNSPIVMSASNHEACISSELLLIIENDAAYFSASYHLLSSNVSSVCSELVNLGPESGAGSERLLQVFIQIAIKAG